MIPPLKPDQVASFDQALAASKNLLTELVASYVVRRREDAATGLAEQFTIMCLTHSLVEDWDEAQMVSALAAAVLVLADHVDA